MASNAVINILDAGTNRTPVVYNVRSLTDVTLNEDKDDQSGQNAVKKSLAELQGRFAVDTLQTNTDNSTGLRAVNQRTYLTNIALHAVRRRLENDPAGRWLLRAAQAGWAESMAELGDVECS